MIAILGGLGCLVLLVVLWPVLKYFAYAAACLWTLGMLAGNGSDSTFGVILAGAPWVLIVLVWMTRAGMEMDS